MIPLNRSFLANQTQISKNSLDEVYSFLKLHHPNKYISLYKSARHALGSIYRSLFLKHGSLRVAVSPLTCFEALYPIIQNGHTPVFVDVEPNTILMSMNFDGQKVDVIQVIHLGSILTGSVEVLNRFSESSLITIEDSAQVFSLCEVDNISSKNSDYSVYSFFKGIWALGGGYCTSKDSYFDENVSSKRNVKLYLYRLVKRYLETKCVSDDNLAQALLFRLMNAKDDQSSNSSHIEGIDTMFITDIVKQLSIVNSALLRKRELLAALTSLIDNNRLIRCFKDSIDMDSISRLYFIHNESHTKNIVGKLRKRGIAANHLSQNWVHSYQESIFDNKSFNKFAQKDRLMNYMSVHDRLFCIPFSPALTVKEIEYIAEAINEL